MSRKGRWALVVATVVAAAMVGGGVLISVARPARSVVVSLTFNDGLSSQFRNAVPVLEEHAVEGTFYVASGWAASGDRKYMATWQLGAIHGGGNEIGGMGVDHKDLTATYSSAPDADLAFKRAQVCDDRQRLSDLGYDPVSFAYPFSAWTEAAASVVKACGYASARLAGGLSPSEQVYAETVPPSDPLAVRTLGLPDSPIRLDSLKDAVTAVASHGGGWLPLAFNEVCDPESRDYGACMSSSGPVEAAVLDAFLDWLSSSAAPEGTTVETVREVVGVSGHGASPLPDPTVVSITFDDGDASQFGVRPILAAHHARATFYINSGAVDARERGAMTWKEIDALASAGNEIGGHTVDHPNLTAADASFRSNWREICDDRQRLIAKGHAVVSFAYPEGAFDAAAERIVRECGYQSARTAGDLSPRGPRFTESLPPENAYAVQALGAEDDGPVTEAFLQDAVRSAVSHGGGWLPIVLHQVCYRGTKSYRACMAGYRPVDSASLDVFLAWCADHAPDGVVVRTVGEVFGGATVPTVVVHAPARGSRVTTPRPELTGGSSAGEVPVEVAVYQGPYSVGAPVSRTTVAPASDGTWTVRLPAPLADGVYTAQAEQALDGETGVSPPVTFRVATPARE